MVRVSSIRFRVRVRGVSRVRVRRVRGIIRVRVRVAKVRVGLARLGLAG